MDRGTSRISICGGVRVAGARVAEKKKSDARLLGRFFLARRPEHQLTPQHVVLCLVRKYSQTNLFYVGESNTRILFKLRESSSPPHDTKFHRQLTASRDFIPRRRQTNINMSNRFFVPDDPPSTPDRSSRSASHSFRFGDNPSTTPAGPPPPAEGASFTPAGAPSASYLGSSIMRGVPPQKPASFNSRQSNNSSKNLFVPKTNSPLGRSISAAKGRHPSRLSRQFVVDDDDEGEGDGAEEDEDEDEEDGIDTRRPPKTFEVQYGDDDDDDDEGPEGSEEGHEGYDEEEDAMGGAEYADATTRKPTCG